jgi:hypothetical protein
MKMLCFSRSSAPPPPLTPHPLHPSPLTPHSSLLTPLAPHPSLLIRHLSPLTLQPSTFTLHTQPQPPSTPPSLRIAQSCRLATAFMYPCIPRCGIVSGRGREGRVIAPSPLDHSHHLPLACDYHLLHHA